MDAYQTVAKRIGARLRDSKDEGLTGDQFQILRLIDAQPCCTSTYLAEACAVGKSSITAIVNRLAEAGFVERTRDEKDRRQVYLSITEEGREVFGVLNQKVSEILTPYLKQFDHHQIELFLNMFETLADLIQEPGGTNE